MGAGSPASSSDGGIGPQAPLHDTVLTELISDLQYLLSEENESVQGSMGQLLDSEIGGAI